MDGKLILDKKTKYWMLFVERGRNLCSSSPMRFQIKEVVLGLNTMHTTIGAYSAKGKKLLKDFCGGEMPSGEDWYNEKVRIATEKFHQYFTLNKVWSYNSDIYYCGFFESKELAEKYLLENGLLDKVIQSAKKSLKDSQQRYFTSTKKVIELIAYKEKLTGVKFKAQPSAGQ